MWFKKAADNTRVPITVTYDVGRPKATPDDFDSLIKANVQWVYRCVNLIAYSVAAVPMRLYASKRTPNQKLLFHHKRLTPQQEKHIYESSNIDKWLSKASEIVEIDDPQHPFSELMNSVNPYMNRSDLIVRRFQHLELTGNHFLYPVIDKRLGIPIELWPLQVQYIKIVPGKGRNLIAGYVYERGGDRETYGPEEIVHFLYPDPNDMLYGRGPMAAATSSYNADSAMRDFWRAMYENSAVLSGVITTPGTLTDDKARSFIGRFRQMFGGRRARQLHGVMVMDQGTDFKPIASSPKELDFIKSNSILRDEIGAIFGIPKSLLTTDDVNRANADAGLRQYEQFTIDPKLRVDEQKINETLMPLYDDSIFVKYDSAISDNRELRLKEIQIHLATGYSSINQERERDGEDPVEWGDKPMVQVPNAPVGADLEPPQKKTLKRGANIGNSLTGE